MNKHILQKDLLSKAVVLACCLSEVPNIKRFKKCLCYLLVTSTFQNIYEVYTPTDPEELVFWAAAAIHKFSLVPFHQIKPHTGIVLSKSGMVPHLEVDSQGMNLSYNSVFINNSDSSI